MTLVKFNHQNRRIDPWVDGLFNSLFHDVPVTKQYVSVNIAESSDKYEVELAAPGFNKSDFNIHLEKFVLQISGEKKKEEKKETSDTENKNEKRYSKREFNYQSFKRSFTLPEDVDENNISANYADGILTISIMKKEAEQALTKQIEIK